MWVGHATPLGAQGWWWSDSECVGPCHSPCIRLLNSFSMNNNGKNKINNFFAVPESKPRVSKKKSGSNISNKVNQLYIHTSRCDQLSNICLGSWAHAQTILSLFELPKIGVGLTTIKPILCLNCGFHYLVILITIYHFRYTAKKRLLKQSRKVKGTMSVKYVIFLGRHPLGKTHIKKFFFSCRTTKRRGGVSKPP